MKIKKLKYSNFRNFKDDGEIIFSTDGKVTIIYGKNGDGKTTLHQLLHWIFYNTVNFNNTTTNKLYNLGIEREAGIGEIIKVMGEIDFIHEGKDYSIHREWYYEKHLKDTKLKDQFIEIQTKEKNEDWSIINSNNPNEFVEEILPSGLSEYFFFDGESMIADLKLNSNDSAKKLKKALFSMFDLVYLENAINHIGKTKTKSSVLGTLDSKKTSNTTNSDYFRYKQAKENAKNDLEQIWEKIVDLETKEKENNDNLKKISETIGKNSKTKEQYERERKRLKDDIFDLQKDIKNEILHFGSDIVNYFPQQLVKKRFEYAKVKIDNNIGEIKKDIIPGLEKELLVNLKKRNKCICEREITKKEIAYFDKLLTLYPPYSYNAMYNNLERNFENMGSDLSLENIENHINRYLEKMERIKEKESTIQELDHEEKQSEKIRDLIEKRQNIEKENKIISHDINSNYEQKKKKELIYNSAKKVVEKFEKENINNKIIDEKIELLLKIQKDFENQLKELSHIYSLKLKENIEFLLNKMLTSKRSVSVTDDFHVRVFDSYNDESKSEGQFAIVSFAYIGAIMKLLKESEQLQSKEYPLVLDGPFSKLDYDQRQNVIDTIPYYAPQVIIFSKDSLVDYFSDDVVGNIYTLTSNDEKNDAHVKEGYLW